MNFGEKLALARKRRGWTQTELAERVGVSVEAVSKWEQNVYEPKGENRRALEALLGLSRLEADGTEALPRHFDEEHMSAFLKGKLNALRLPETQRALDFAKECHEGQYRKPGKLVPYINHPLTMACHALAMGLEDDSLLSALLLHDVVEECRPRVGLADLPVSAETREIVRLVTKPERGYSPAEYFAAIGKNPKACLVKCIDRCNNLSTMAIGFTLEKVAEYIEETETWYPPLLRVVKGQPEFNNAAWLLSYQIKSLLATAKRISNAT